MEILQQCDRGVKTKSQEVLRTNFRVWKNYKGNSVRRAYLLLTDVFKSFLVLGYILMKLLPITTGSN